MTTTFPVIRPADRTFKLLGRLWREHLIHYKLRLALVLALTLLMAGTTALYPVVINHAFDMFTERTTGGSCIRFRRW